MVMRTTKTMMIHHKALSILFEENNNTIFKIDNYKLNDDNNESEGRRQ